MMTVALGLSAWLGGCCTGRTHRPEGAVIGEHLYAAETFFESEGMNLVYDLRRRTVDGREVVILVANDGYRLLSLDGEMLKKTAFTEYGRPRDTVHGKTLIANRQGRPEFVAGSPDMGGTAVFGSDGGARSGL